jgi:hypothetical protein
VIASGNVGWTVGTMYITQEHTRWPRTVTGVAARLRQVVDLPSLTVRTQKDRVSITWVGGPPSNPVYTEFESA